VKLPRSVRISAAFTLIEIMIVVGIIALIAAIGIPGFVQAKKKGAMAQSIGAVFDGCKDARAAAILQGKTMELVISAKDGKVSVQGGSQPASGSGNGAPAAVSDKSGSFTSELSPDVAVEMLDVNFQNLLEQEQAKVRFFPNGTSDEFTIVLRSFKQEYVKISLNIMTALPSVEVIR
jgi:prepilin-type N-terminal cleavage/methylation domain-containing protein